MTDVVFLTGYENESSLTAQKNPYRVYIAGLAPGSQKTMAGCLDRIARIYLIEAGADPAGVDALAEPGDQFPWWRLEYQHTAKIVALLKNQGWAPTYVNKHIAGLKMALKHSWKLGLMSAEDYHRAAELEGDKGRRLPPGRSIAAAELEALLRVCMADGSASGRRDAAIVAVFYSTGLRLHELAKSLLEDYQPGERSLRVIGKRSKERRVYLTEQAAQFLGAWLAHSGHRSGPIFLGLHRSGAPLAGLKPMTPGAVGQIIDRRRIEAGLPRLAAHDFRRTHIGDLLDAGVDLATVSQLAGHSSTTTTAGYDRRHERTKQSAIDRLVMPAIQDF